MKSYVTDGTGSQQTLADGQDNKIPIYESKADIEADLANLSEGQIVATPDTGDELSQPVDVVEEDNLHAVTSNAVANYIKTIDIQIDVAIDDWVTNTDGGFYCNRPVTNYLASYAKLLSITSIRWSGFSMSGFFLGFDSMGSNISIATNTKKAGQLNARIVYI